MTARPTAVHPYANAPTAQLRPPLAGAWARGRPVVGVVTRADLLSTAGTFELAAGLVIHEDRLRVGPTPGWDDPVPIVLAEDWQDHVIRGTPIARIVYALLSGLVATGALRPPAEVAS